MKSTYGSTLLLAAKSLLLHLKPTFLEVGDNNVFRENCNINRSTFPETKTIIGSNNLFLINSHCGHECVVGNNCIVSGYSGIAGHCVLGDWAIVGGCTAVHQFVRIGEHAMVGGGSRIAQDVPPFTIVEGNPAIVRSINMIGMQRRGFTEEDVRAMKLAYKKLFLKKGCNIQEGIEAILADEKYGDNPNVKKLIDFINSSERGFIH